MKEKIFKTAPLPFQGQKRNFVKQFQEALKEFVEVHGVTTVVDLFGGSGLLSHTAKRMYPQLRVVYNDFDDFHKRLDNVAVTNELLDEIRPLVYGLKKGTKLDAALKKSILSFVKTKEKEGCFVDYVTLSGSLLFLANYVTCYEELAKATFYSRARTTNYDVSGYLDGLEITSQDYKSLYTAYKDQPHVLFVIDPPYLSTDVITYNRSKYWRLKDYLDVLNLLEGHHYIYFTSNKSSLVELFEWLEANSMLRNPFSQAKIAKYHTRLNISSGYTDLMYWKNRKIK